MNSKAFTPEEVKKGLHLDLIKYLLSYGNKSDKYFYDIHIFSDGYCTIIEWVESPYNDDDGVYQGRFGFIDEDEDIMKEIKLPDNSYAYVHRGEEDEYLNKWLEDNPGWEKDAYGLWNKI